MSAARAFLSTGAAHAEDGSRYVPGFNVETAEREARAILAENEGGSLNYIAGSYPALSELTYDERMACTEALAAFVGGDL